MTSKITCGQYNHFLISLKHVCNEVDCTLNNESEISRLETDPQVRKMMDGMPSMSAEDAANKIKEYIEGNKGLLLFYEAAKRSDNQVLARYFLSQWAQKLDGKVTKKFGECNDQDPSRIFHQFFGNRFSLGAPSASATLEGVDGKIEKIGKKFLWPRFSDQTREKELIDAQKHLMSKELTFRHFHQEAVTFVPPHVSPLLGDSSPNATTSYLIERYAPLMETISFADPRLLKDDEVKLFLRRFSCAKTLDLTNCISITPACLSQGHPTLECIILNGTCIKPESIDREKFPCLSEIRQENVVSILRINELSESLPWSAIRAKIEEASTILGSMGTICTKFIKNPSVEAVGVMSSVVNHASKFRDEMAVQLQIAELFLRSWEGRPSEDWKSPNPVGHHLVQALIQFLLESKDQRVKDSIANAFYNTLTLTEKRTTKEVIATIYEKDIYRIRALLVSLRTLEWPAYKSILDKLHSRLRDSETVLFYKKEPGREIETHKLMEEIYVELSHRVPLDFALPYCFLEDPAKATRRHDPFQNDSLVFFNIFLNAMAGETHHPGPCYKMVTDHSLASAFAVKVSVNKNRESMLEKILKNFSDYRSETNFYPLHKLVLGVIHDNDIPEDDRGGPLSSHLSAYKGVFFEEISDELKEAYWKALIHGYLGGVSEALIDSLALFYRKPESTEFWKQRVLTALKEMGGEVKGPLTGFAYHNPLTDSRIKAHAREVKKQLAH